MIKKHETETKAEYLLLDPLDKILAIADLVEIVARTGDMEETTGIGIGKILKGVADEIYEIGQWLDEVRAKGTDVEAVAA
jgi:hypothetical protein